MPPCCWPLDEHRVEDPSAVVDRDVAQQPDVAGFHVDLDDGHVRAERKRRATAIEVEIVTERTWLHALRAAASGRWTPSPASPT